MHEGNSATLNVRSNKKKIMKQDLTHGPVVRTMLMFAFPMILGNLLQQFYNIADTFIVGRFLGPNSLAAVGSSFTLMTFLTSILLGLCMGSSIIFSIRFGKKDEDGLKERIFVSFVFIASLTMILNIAIYLGIDWILDFLHIPAQVYELMKSYLVVIFSGLFATFLYNFFASLLRAVGNSMVPLIFLAISAITNIILDLWFVLGLKLGVTGAAQATVIAQFISGIGIALYTWVCFPKLRIQQKHCHIKYTCIREIMNYSLLTCIQQSIMNLGILMVQGLVNSFGPIVMSAFAAAVKIDAFAYMPVQDFGNAFSTFIAQNYGARKKNRICDGLKGALWASILFCVVISIFVWIFAESLMMIFVNAKEVLIIQEGVRYLRIEGIFYCSIGCLFLLYGLYRGLAIPEMSIILTVLSLGTRVILAYALSAISAIGVVGIWWSVPIGWGLADFVGYVYYRYKKEELFNWKM